MKETPPTWCRAADLLLEEIRFGFGDGYHAGIEEEREELLAEAQALGAGPLVRDAASWTSRGSGGAT